MPANPYYIEPDQDAKLMEIQIKCAIDTRMDKDELETWICKLLVDNGLAVNELDAK